MQDAVSALVNLGYRKAEVEKSVRETVQAGNTTLEEVIKEALRRISR
jgi:Holliday junction resolvasome RuvABC DNA-binding subunit